MSEENSLTKTTKDAISQLTTAGVISCIANVMATGDVTGLGILLFVVLPSLGAQFQVIKGLKSNAATTFLNNELKKIDRALGSVIKEMERSNIDKMNYLLSSDIPMERYNLVRTLFNEAMDAKFEAQRDYLASMIVLAGSSDLEETDFSMMYKCLEILRELNADDYKIMKLYELILTDLEKYEILKNELLENGTLSTQEIMLCMGKLARLGIFNRSTALSPYESKDSKREMLKQVNPCVLTDPEDPFTPIFKIFKTYIPYF